MGCVVNGPGESKHANLGISLPGTGEDPKAPVYVDGKLATILHGDDIIPDFIAILDKYVASHYPAASDSRFVIRVIRGRFLMYLNTFA